MKSLKINSSWLFILIPVIAIIFIAYPNLKKVYDLQDKRKSELMIKEQRLEELNNKKNLTLRERNEVKRLEIQVKVGKDVAVANSLNNILPYGLFGILGAVFIGMFISSYRSSSKKKDPNNRVIDFTFEDPSQDAIGNSISWSACANGGSNFRSERFIKTKNGYKIDSTIYVKLFSWAFLLAGLLWTVFSFVKAIKQGKELGFMEAGSLFFTSGGIFLIVGIALFFMFAPKVYILTSKRIVIAGDAEKIPFNQVYALQVLEKIVYGKHTYPSYEVNLVTNTGERYNLLNHGDKDYILSDMVKISKLFRIPVWNMGVQ